MGMEMRMRAGFNFSVKTRVLESLRKFPATVRELEADGCGSRGSIRRALRAIGVVRMAGGRQPRYALRAGAGYKFL